MLGELLVLLGLGLFLKIFFNTASRAKKNEEKNNKSGKRKNLIIHVVLGVALVAVGSIFT